MYKLIRRISSSFFSRPDRPWNEDATSTAPQIGQKRRHSSFEDDDEPIPSGSKRHKASLAVVHDDVETDLQSQTQPAQASEGKEGEGVKEVTQGVREVELEDRDGDAEVVAGAAAVPLPDSPVIKAQAEPADPELATEESAKVGTDGPTESLGSIEMSEELSVPAVEVQPLSSGEEPEDTPETPQVDAETPSSTEETKVDEENLQAEQVDQAVLDKNDILCAHPEIVETINA